MNSAHNISDAGLYTDFSGLQKLRTKISGQENTAESQAANKEVAKQFEALFLQMMLKSMRDASAIGDSTESDQTRFYQEMFDKQIALDLANNSSGGGLGIAAILEQDMGGAQASMPKATVETDLAVSDIEQIRNQISYSNSVIQNKYKSSEQE